MAGTRRTRILLALATATVITVGASACSSTSSSSSADSITYWSMWRADEPQGKAVKAAADQFTASTGIKVNLEFIGRDVRTKIGPAIAANQAPDLWDQGSDVIYGQTASAGQALDLTPVLSMKVPGEGKTVGDVVPAKYLKALPKDPSGVQNYVIPYIVDSAELFYNAADPDIQAAMKTPPTTWADFIKVCDALKARNKPCLASEGEDAWTNGLQFDYQLSALGVNFADLTNDKTGAAWDNSAVLQAAQETEQLVKGGYIVPGYDATKAPAQETAWASGKDAFWMTGSWATSETAKEVASTWKYGAMLPPGVTAPDSMTFGFSIPKRAKNSKAAEEFIAYFLQKKNLTNLASTSDSITTRADVPAPADLADVQKSLDANAVRLTYDGQAGSVMDKVFSPNFLDLWHGKITAAQFVAKMKSGQIAFWKTQG
ncbi:ABC transporter substrate-binding protein [Streptomyces sp. NPDC101455]|uniref:ABC transporter substrate-binding protein n=1 Tax=Streptomyces sp. NPDC101455 TaxID=3366142 RepID=UPI00380C1C01